jgi:PHP family Zn ribbon phosphoesterase
MNYFEIAKSITMQAFDLKTCEACHKIFKAEKKYDDKVCYHCRVDMTKGFLELAQRMSEHVNKV